MAEQDIIAVFRADIEQFKAQMAQLQRSIKGVDASATQLVDRFGVPFKKAVDGSTEATDRFGRSTKSAGGSIHVLSRGLGGMAGLLGVTGRLFGVNTDKIEGLVFASQQFVRVGRDFAQAQRLAAAGSVTAAAATTRLTTAQKILNAVLAINPFVLLIAGAAALGAGIGFLITKYGLWGFSSEEQREKNEELLASNELLKNSVQELGRIYDEEINKRKALGESTEQLEREALERQLKSVQAQIKNFNELSGMTESQFAERVVLLNQEASLRNDLIILEANRKAKELSALREFQKELRDINEEANEENKKEAARIAEEKKKQAEKDLKDAKERADKLLMQELDDMQKAADEKIKKANELRDEINAADKASTDSFNEQADKEREKKTKAGEKEAEKKTKAGEKEADRIEKLRIERIEQEQKMLDIISNAYQEAFDKRQALLDEERANQEKAIETQRSLAERGLNNTLAFEEKRAAELRRQQQKEKENVRKVKLLETFLNSLAEFSKTDPKTALQKALLQVALATAATAVFAEEGGVIGEIKDRSVLGGRRHRGGGDVLLHAQTGEGILSRREMDNLGRRNFHLLKDAARFPIKDNVFAMPNVAAMGGVAVSDNRELVKEVKAMRSDIKNIKQINFDLNQFGEYTRTQVENGVREITKGKFRKPRFRS